VIEAYLGERYARQRAAEQARQGAVPEPPMPDDAGKEGLP
jgi:hypothetical protein